MMGYRIPDFKFFSKIIGDKKEGFTGRETHHVGKNSSEFWVECVHKHPKTGHLIGSYYSLDKKWRQVDHDRLRTIAAKVWNELECACEECHPLGYEYLYKD